MEGVHEGVSQEETLRAVKQERLQVSVDFNNRFSFLEKCKPKFEARREEFKDQSCFIISFIVIGKS